MKKFGDKSLRLIIDSCPRCHGLWFDGGEISRFLTSEGLKQQFLTDVRAKGAHSYSLVSGDRNCPRCRQVMERPVVGGVTLDVCRDCSGVWFDHGELTQLVTDYQKKGLRGDQTVIGEIRRGLKSGDMSDDLWSKVLEALKELLAKVFPKE